MGKVNGRKIPDSIREQVQPPSVTGLMASPSDQTLKYSNSRKIVYEWIDYYKQYDWDGLKTRIGKTGSEPRPSPEQQEKIYFIIKARTPVGPVIRQHYGTGRSLPI